MMSTRLLLVATLMIPAASAQHGGSLGGGFARAGGAARSASTHGTRIIGSRQRNRGFARGGFGYGLGYGWPDFSAWDYNSLAPLDYGDAFAGQYPQYPYTGNILVVPPTVEPAPPPKPASGVIHEYNFGPQTARPGGARPNFTIVLKDGSTRSAQASWVTDGRLHYLDLQARQQVLSPELIDRDATERANEAKNLSMELPPG